MPDKQLKAMIDTNLYERIFKYDLQRILELIGREKILVYGCKTIRDELRNIPKSVRFEGKSYRGQLLSLYDDLVGKHSFPVENVAESLAMEYWEEYKGGVPKRKIFPDFLIVSTATIHNLDIIVSGDERTMKSGPAKKAYDIANRNNGFTTPRFISINELF